MQPSGQEIATTSWMTLIQTIHNDTNTIAVTSPTQAGAALSLEAATATAAQQAARAQMQLAMGRLMENTEEKGAGRSAPGWISE